MGFTIYSLVSRVQELAARVGWLQRESAQARLVIEHLLVSADCAWEEREEGHDWAYACKEAREFLALASPIEEGGT